MSKIRIGIVGYGNIGRGVELAVERNEDMELVAVVTRRDPKSVQILTEGVKKVHFDDILTLKDEVDVMILCGGSATDLPVMGPEIAKHFNMIDSFDTHAKIPEYFADVDTAANEGKKVGIISVGWDPGMFSLNRIYAESILVQGSTYTFWGKADYDTTVTFVSEEELKAEHSKMPHGGFVIRTGETGREGNKHVIEYSLKLDSNPEFTSSVLVAYARAAYRLANNGDCGAKTVFDIAPGLLSMKSAEQLRKEIL